MSSKIITGAVHHQALTVTNLAHSVEFYTDVLGFQKAMDISPTRSLLANGNTLQIYVLAFRDPGNI